MAAPDDTGYETGKYKYEYKVKGSRLQDEGPDMSPFGNAKKMALGN